MRANCSRTPPEATGCFRDCQNPLSLLILLLFTPDPFSTSERPNVTRAPACWTLPLVVMAMLAACGSDPTPPTTLDCSAVATTNLAPGQFTILDATQSACVRFPGAGSTETEHLYVALATEGSEAGNGVSADYRLQVGSAPTASVASLSRTKLDRAPTRAQGFHDRLRARERDLSSQPAVV